MKNQRKPASILLISMLTSLTCTNLPGQAEPTAEALTELEAFVVTATRTKTPISEVTRSVSTVELGDLEDQIELDLNLSSILARAVPGMGPSTEAVSNFGQSLRGRNFLVLIDGVPQSTPLRDGFRDLNTIDHRRSGGSRWSVAERRFTVSAPPGAWST